MAETSLDPRVLHEALRCRMAANNGLVLWSRDRSPKATVTRFAEAERLTIVGELVEIETGKGADALDRRSSEVREGPSGPKCIVEVGSACSC
jgi:hypothetical protein